jgi:hypothetical protein
MLATVFSEAAAAVTSEEKAARNAAFFFRLTPYDFRLDRLRA